MRLRSRLTGPSLRQALHQGCQWVSPLLVPSLATDVRAPLLTTPACKPLRTVDASCQMRTTRGQGGECIGGGGEEELLAEALGTRVVLLHIQLCHLLKMTSLVRRRGAVAEGAQAVRVGVVGRMSCGRGVTCRGSCESSSQLRHL